MGTIKIFNKNRTKEIKKLLIKIIFYIKYYRKDFLFMSKLIDLTGQDFGYWYVMYRA